MKLMKQSKPASEFVSSLNPNNNTNKNTATFTLTKFKEKITMSKTINFAAANNVEFAIVINNNEATFRDALNAAVEQGYITSANISNMIMLDDTDITDFVEDLADVCFEDGCTVELACEASSAEPAAESTAEGITSITVTITAAGSISPMSLNLNRGETVINACRMGRAVLNMTEQEITNAEKFVNDVVVNNNTALKDGDTVTVAVRCAGVKGAAEYELSVDTGAGRMHKVYKGALLALPKRALINSLVKEAVRNGLIDNEDYTKIVVDGCTLAVNSAFAETWLNTPLTDDTYIAVQFENNMEDENEEDDDDDDFFDEDEDEEFPMEVGTPGFINIQLPGGVSTATYDITMERTTVRDIVTDNRILALSGMNANQALNMRYTVNDVAVELDDEVEGGDTLAMFTREAGVKGV